MLLSINTGGISREMDKNGCAFSCREEANFASEQGLTSSSSYSFLANDVKSLFMFTSALELFQTISSQTLLRNLLGRWAMLQRRADKDRNATQTPLRRYQIVFRIELQKRKTLSYVSPLQDIHPQEAPPQSHVFGLSKQTGSQKYPRSSLSLRTEDEELKMLGRKK
ncbi:hypothetical protein JTE90_005918 [Oedothorax gibbosus]|uniref:Uncharacterized protein n=1 Tax=Oedothorax gibbosus TaxID=931172 RepID=A0AAV6UA11_9ARAC|nr:hypothetical protein JTE90_005918 [Oedothorax gibbosus]